MAKIELSAGLMYSTPAFGQLYNGKTGYQQRMVEGGIAGQYTVGPGVTGLFYTNYTNPNIKIMKGTIPTDFSSLTSATSRASDVLITFSQYGTDAPGKITADYTVNPIVATSQYKAADASGTATWFWAYMGASDFQNLMIGTVGTINSGADLEISTTSITSGLNYRIENLKIQLPSSWTY